MADISQIKAPKTYSLSPAVVAWVTQRAARQTIEGPTTSDSKLVNDILTAAMEEDIRQEQARQQLPHSQPKNKKNHSAQAVAA